jgi:hypothetical protein
MVEKKGNQKEFSTCLEDISFAEMMQRMMGQKGVGSLCAEMMKKVTEKKGDGCNTSCVEMMRSMMKGCCSVGKEESKETKETKKEEGHVGDK